ncbi:MAG TPA: SPOR domain-containing protein [Burkholderiales bacterium]|nr:SPOR domain-containing protein [Burkholderiales bacterium]
MSKDYKASERQRGARRGARRSGGSLLAGILMGLVLGLFIALGVAWYITKTPNPFASRGQALPPAKTETPKASPAPTAKVEDKAKTEDTKPRFDFYKMLPGEDSEKQAKEPKGSTPATKDAFFLQAGAFQNAPDADNLKARLALLGVEASIETSAVSDKGVWHRVRIGPYTSVEELNRTRDTLKQNGVQTTLIKQKESER